MFCSQYSILKELCDNFFVVGTAATEWGNLNAMGIFGSNGAVGQVAALNSKGRLGLLILMNSRVKAPVRID